MFTGAGSQVVSDLDRLRRNFHALREANAGLRGTCARHGLTAARSRETATWIAADAKRLRGEVLRVRLPREPGSGALARRLLEDHLSPGLPEAIDDVKTVVSELVINAIVHGRGAIELRVSRRHGRVRVDVRDEGKDATIRAGMADRPHGLDIVEALALSWGAQAGRTRVWAELRDGGPASD